MFKDLKRKLILVIQFQSNTGWLAGQGWLQVLSKGLCHEKNLPTCTPEAEHSCTPVGRAAQASGQKTPALYSISRNPNSPPSQILLMKRVDLFEEKPKSMNPKKWNGFLQVLWLLSTTRSCREAVSPRLGMVWWELGAETPLPSHYLLLLYH